MYMHCKVGFIEADAWDGAPITDKVHADYVQAMAPGKVFVVRSREAETLTALAPAARLFRSPPSWDYTWRVYLTEPQYIEVLISVARDVDYRNFKSWCSSRNPGQFQLATEIWHAAHDADRLSRKL